MAKAQSGFLAQSEYAELSVRSCTIPTVVWAHKNGIEKIQNSDNNIFMILGYFGASGWHIALSKVPGKSFKWTDDGYPKISRHDTCPSLNQIIVDF